MSETKEASAKTEKTDFLKKANEQLNGILKEAYANGNAVFQLPKEERAKAQAPALFYRNKSGEIKESMVPVTNVLPAIQFMHDHQKTDNRFMVASAALSDKSIHIQKGAKSMPMVLFTKDKKPYTVRVFNLSDLTGENVPKTTVSRPRSDSYARDMVNYLAMRVERGTFKDNMMMMCKDAKEAASKNYQQMKPRYAEYDKRLKEIKDIDLSKPVNKDDFKGNFMHMMKEELEGKSPTHYVVNAAKKAMQTLKWPEETVKKAIESFAPASAYDGLDKKRAPYKEYILDGIKKSKEYQASKQAQAAK